MALVHFIYSRRFGISNALFSFHREYFGAACFAHSKPYILRCYRSSSVCCVIWMTEWNLMNDISNMKLRLLCSIFVLKVLYFMQCCKGKSRSRTLKHCIGYCENESWKQENNRYDLMDFYHFAWKNRLLEGWKYTVCWE